MIKHFCDICGNEMSERIRVSITAKEVYGEGYLQTVGKTLWTPIANVAVSVITH